jgi:hypothetical protein
MLLETKVYSEQSLLTCHLNASIIRNRMEGLNTVRSRLNKSGFTRHDRKSLQMHSRYKKVVSFTLQTESGVTQGVGHTSSSLCSLAFLSVLLDSPQEIVTTSRVSNMFHTHMQSLLNVPVPHNLVDHDTDGALGDVEDDAGLAMVVLVWQTLLLSSIPDDIDNISDLVLLELQNELAHNRIHFAGT